MSQLVLYPQVYPRTCRVSCVAMPGDRYSGASRRRHSVNGNVAGRAARLPAAATSRVPAAADSGRESEPDVLTSLVLADDLPDGLIVADQAGRVAVFNRAATRLTGIAAAGALGRDVWDVLPLRDRDDRCWWSATKPYDGLSTRTRHPER